MISKTIGFRGTSLFSDTPKWLIDPGELRPDQGICFFFGEIFPDARCGQDGVDNTGASKDKLYSTPEDVFKAARHGDSQPVTKIPSGEHTKSNGKSPFLMGKSTISMAIFHCYVSSPEGRLKLQSTSNQQNRHQPLWKPQKKPPKTISWLSFVPTLK